MLLSWQKLMHANMRRKLQLTLAYLGLYWRQTQDKEAIIIDSMATAADYPSLLMQRVLSTRVGHEEEMTIQRNNLFHMYFIVQGCRVLTIIDSGSCRFG
jgi:hypothetical protein